MESLLNKIAGQSPPPTRLLSCKYCEIFNNAYFEKHLRTAGWFWKRNFLMYKLIFRSIVLILLVFINSNNELLRSSKNSCEVVFSKVAGFLRILTGKMHPKIKLQRLRKCEYGHLGRWCIKVTLFKRF